MKRIMKRIITELASAAIVASLLLFVMGAFFDVF